jgi:hypothetical protein
VVDLFVGECGHQEIIGQAIQFPLIKFLAGNGIILYHMDALLKEDSLLP